LRYALFWDIAQRIVVNPYRRFGTTYLSQESAHLIYFAAEASNHHQGAIYSYKNRIRTEV